MLYEVITRQAHAEIVEPQEAEHDFLAGQAGEGEADAEEQAAEEDHDSTPATSIHTETNVIVPTIDSYNFV